MFKLLKTVWICIELTFWPILLVLITYIWLNKKSDFNNVEDLSFIILALVAGLFVSFRKYQGYRAKEMIDGCDKNLEARLWELNNYFLGKCFGYCY